MSAYFERMTPSTAWRLVFGVCLSFWAVVFYVL